jgi:hypothetical protein
MFFAAFSLLVYAAYQLLIDFSSSHWAFVLDLISMIFSIYIIGWLLEKRNLFESILDDETAIFAFPFLFTYRLIVSLFQ